MVKWSHSKPGHMVKWSHGHMVTWSHGHMVIWSYGHMFLPNRVSSSRLGMGGGVGGRGMNGAGSGSILSTVSVSASGSGFGSCLKTDGRLQYSTSRILEQEHIFSPTNYN